MKKEDLILIVIVIGVVFTLVRSILTPTPNQEVINSNLNEYCSRTSSYYCNNK